MIKFPILYRLDYRLSINTIRHMCACKNPPTQEINPQNLAKTSHELKDKESEVNRKRKLPEHGPDLFQFLATSGW